MYVIGERMDGSDRLQYVELMDGIPVQTRKLVSHREFRLATCAGKTLYKIALTFIYNFRHVAGIEPHCCPVVVPHIYLIRLIIIAVIIRIATYEQY